MSEKQPELPPPPVKPDSSECCKSDCNPCILEQYEDELERWKAQVARIRAGARAGDGDQTRS